MIFITIPSIMKQAQCSHMEKDNVDIKKQLKSMTQQYKLFEQELISSKQKLGDAINAALQFGGPELVDKIANAMKIN